MSFEYATGMYVTRMHICKVCLPDLAKKLADKEVKIKLRNGAEVIKTKTDSTGGIVLACWARNVNDEYITWEVNSKGDTYSGHYFSNVEDAEKDYSVRVLNYFRRK